MKKSHVIMMCGIAGSGKTTYALQREKEGYIRLSIDKTLWKNYGRDDVDYPKSLYEKYCQKLKKHLIDHLENNENVIFDFSFGIRLKEMSIEKLFIVTMQLLDLYI